MLKLALIGGTICGAAIFACSGATDARSSSEDVTSIPETSVVDQGATNNCWLYATAAWIESLQLQAAGNSIHYSPAYWHYWRLYEELVRGDAQATDRGCWGWAAGLIHRYGLVPMGSFAVDDAAVSMNAIATVNAKIAAGVLPASGKRDGAAVRAVLDDVFQLSADNRALLNTVFGADGSGTFTATPAAVPAGIIQMANAISIRSMIEGDGGFAIGTTTLDQAIGSNYTDPDVPADMRTGANSWSAMYPPSMAAIPDGGTADQNPIAGLYPLVPPDQAAWRKYYQRIQRAMNDGFPLPLGFKVNDDDVGATGHWTAGSSIVSSKRYDGHVVLMSDYEITNVPAFGTLPVGTPATDAQKQASLDDDAAITFFRVKNSWGLGTHGVNTDGYSDIDTAYLEQPMDVCADNAPQSSTTCVVHSSEVIDVILPPGY